MPRLGLTVPLLIVSALSAYAADVAPHPQWRNSLAPQGEPGPLLALAEGGATEYVILLPRRPTGPEQKAAEDLALWLGQMTGATFPLVRERPGTRVTGREISIGRTRLAARVGVVDTGTDLSRCGYSIAVRGKSLFVLGGRQRGVINGVYCLLEEDLGCRWYAPGTQSIPRRPTLRFRPVQRTYVPALEDRRDPYNADTMFDVDWSLRNKTLGAWAKVPPEWGGHPGWPGAHTLQRYVPPSLFAQHPEYFSEVAGTRNPAQPCLSNPGVLDLVIPQVRAELRDRPETRVLDISLNDLPPSSYCTCPDCRRLTEAEGSSMAPVLQFINAVAEAIEDDHPETKINTLAYQGTVTPPKTTRPRPNVCFWLCTDARWSRLNDYVGDIEAIAEAFEGWSALGANIIVWDYPSYFQYLQINHNMPVYQQNIQFFIRHGATGVMYQYADAESNHGADHSFLLSWVGAKQMWDPSRDTRALVRDFNYGYYGEAAAQTQQYDDMLWEAWERGRMDGGTSPIDRVFVARGWELMKQAEALANGDEVLTKRVKTAQLPLMYTMATYGPGRDSEALDLDEFEKTARDAGMRYIHIDGAGPNVDRYFVKLRELFAIDPDDIGFVELSNEWRFAPDPKDAGLAQSRFAADFDDSGWVTIDSSRGWEPQGFEGYDGYGWYRQVLEVPADLLARDDLKLLFLAVDEQAWVFINGEKAFEHTTAATGRSVAALWKQPFMFDPRPWLKPGRNVLAVRVHDSTMQGGIWRPHYLAWGKGLTADSFEDVVRLRRERSESGR